MKYRDISKILKYFPALYSLMAGKVVINTINYHYDQILEIIIMFLNWATYDLVHEPVPNGSSWAVAT